MKKYTIPLLLRITCDKERCVNSGACKKVCPMNVDMTNNSRRRANGTECILCMECTKVCPEKNVVNKKGAAR